MIAPTAMAEPDFDGMRGIIKGKGKGGRVKTPLAELGTGQANFDSAPPMDLRLHLAMKRAVVAACAEAEQLERAQTEAVHTEPADSTAVEPKRKRKGKKKKAPLPCFLPDYVEPVMAPSGITHLSREMLEDLGMRVPERAVPPAIKPIAEPAVEAAVEPVVEAASPIGEALFQRKMRFPDRRASSAVLMMMMPEAEEVASAVSSAPVPVEEVVLDLTLEAAALMEADPETQAETQAASSLEQVVHAIDAAIEAIGLAIDVADAAEGGDEAIDVAAEAGALAHDVTDQVSSVGWDVTDQVSSVGWDVTDQVSSVGWDVTDQVSSVGWEHTESMGRPLIEALPESHATVAKPASKPATAPAALIRTGLWPRGMLFGLVRYVKRILYGMHAISEQMRAPRLTLASADNSQIKDA